jgi:hypothetical protein
MTAGMVNLGKHGQKLRQLDLDEWFSKVGLECGDNRITPAQNGRPQAPQALGSLFPPFLPKPGFMCEELICNLREVSSHPHSA